MTAAAEAVARKAPLEDLMVAMDVVDTVRHQELIIDRELDAQGRRQRLLARLRDLYSAQGIEVTDAALEAGVDALEQERFGYTPSAGGFSTKLARIYVRRDRWLKQILGALVLGLIIWLAWYFMAVRPEAQWQAALPAKIERAYARITAISEDDDATQKATTLSSQARQAIGQEKFQLAEDLLKQMQTLRGELASSYEVRIVSRPNELSGVWRVPDINPNARNYYLIVEAVTKGGEILPVQIRNEEDGRIRKVTTWGIRVDEETFDAVAADKRDDGIVQDYVVGAKKSGHIDADYSVPTIGATITEW